MFDFGETPGSPGSDLPLKQPPKGTPGGCSWEPGRRGRIVSFTMSEKLTHALFRAALTALTSGSLVLVYCVAFTLVTDRNAGEVLPSLTLAYAVLAAFMLGCGVNSEQRDDLPQAENFYTRALGYHAVATAAYVVLKV